MPRTAAVYDAYYACLKLAPGAPLSDILRARRRMAVRYHPDKIKDPRIKCESEERVKEVFHACDELNAYWREFKIAPPSVAAERRRREAIRLANVPISVPPIQKTLLHDLVDWMEAHGRTQVMYILIFAAVLMESFLLVRLLVAMLSPFGFAWNSSCGALAFFLMAVQWYLLGYGLYSFTELYQLDRRREPHYVPVNCGVVREKVRQILERHRYRNGRWVHEQPHADAADASTEQSSRLEFKEKLFRAIEIRYSITLSLKVKAAAADSSSQVVYWFQREATAPWWPPALSLTRELERDLRRALHA